MFILKGLIEIISSEEFKESYRTEKRFFTRSRLLTFQTIILMQLNFISKSISVEVSKFLARFHFSRKEKDVSKQAFSKARKHIKWEGFEFLNKGLVKQFYAIDEGLIKYQNKYLLLATDGTTYQLPYEKELIKEFKTSANVQGQTMCMAQGLKLFDVLNKISIGSALHPFNTKGSKGNSEKALFNSQLNELPQLIDNEHHKVIVLGDKYYPSFYYFHKLPLDGYNYLFRCNSNFCNEMTDFVKSDEVDKVYNIDLTINKRQYSNSLKGIANKPSSVETRFVKVMLNNGEIEYLATNLSKKEFGLPELKELFGLRWNVEVSFDTDKNKLEIESFSSKLPNGVRQDFHAKILSSNITQLLISDAQQQLDEEQVEKNNKHKYQINRAVAIGLVKDELPKLLFEYEPIEIWYNRMLKKILRRREPVRKGRNFKKEKKHNLKHNMTKRRVT